METTYKKVTLRSIFVICVIQNGPFGPKHLVNRFFHIYKVVQIWPGLIVCKQVAVSPGHIWTTLYNKHPSFDSRHIYFSLLLIFSLQWY
jgi:hypothetical protein